jgi:hypothetical protein
MAALQQDFPDREAGKRPPVPPAAMTIFIKT